MQSLPFERTRSIQDMASFLFALTVGVDEGEGLSRPNEELDEISAYHINPEVARVELALLKFSAICTGLLAFQDVRDLHGDKIDEVDRAYVAEFKARGSRDGEDAFLQISQTRLTAYTTAFDAWREAHRSGRGQEQTFAIGQAFFRFCGVENNNPVTLFQFGHKFNTIVRVVHDHLMKCRLE